MTGHKNVFEFLLRQKAAKNISIGIVLALNVLNFGQIVNTLFNVKFNLVIIQQQLFFTIWENNWITKTKGQYLDIL